MKDYDVLVVGGGAAGLSAALVLARARRTVAVVDAGGPRNAPAAHTHGFLSRYGLPPGDLVAAGRSEVSGNGGRLIDDTVVGVEPGFHVRLVNASPLRARRILIAASTRCWCASGRPTFSCSRAHRHSRPRAARTAAGPGHPDADGAVARLVVGNDQLEGVELRDGTVVARTAVFVRPCFVPNAELLTGLGCELDELGWVVHDPAGRTSVAGVWVAGNAADPRAQVISAAGQGSAAAIALNADLVDEDVKHALADHRTGHTARPA